MQYRPLGATDLQVSALCLGTMTFGEQNTEAEAHEQLDYALDQGINFIDTAEMYAVPGRKETFGRTERYIGTWIAGRGRRDDFVLATKVTGPRAGFDYVSDDLSFGRDRVRAAVERSLRQLQIDYIDLYQLHWPERKTNFFGQRGYKQPRQDDWQDNFDAVVATMDELVREGKIRHWGLSNETPWGVMRALAACAAGGTERPVSIQNPYSLLNRTFEVGNAEVALREQVGLLAYSPMAFGLLSGKYHRRQDEPTDRLNQFKMMARYNGANSYEATKRYMEVAERHGLSLAQMALAFVTSRAFVTSTIIGATSMAQLEENIGSAELVLSAEVLREIEKIHENMPNPAP